MFSAVPIIYRISFIVLVGGALCFGVVRERVHQKADRYARQAAVCVQEKRYSEAERLYKRALRKYRCLGDEAAKKRTMSSLAALEGLTH